MSLIGVSLLKRSNSWGAGPTKKMFTVTDEESKSEVFVSSLIITLSSLKSDS